MSIDYRFFVSMFFVVAEMFFFLISMNQLKGVIRKLFIPLTILGWCANAIPPMVLFGWIGIIGTVLATLAGMKIYYILHPAE